ncbi:WD repeat-containing protein GTS1 [Citrus sinensis]|nr:WD repeat-containing protein GTS1 [Citrus sinensis]
MSIIDSWSRNDWSLMAVSLSTNVVKLYSPVTGQYSGECKGHSSTVNQISFSGPSTPHVLHSCSSDGTIRAWDTRSFHEVWSVTAGSQEIFCFSFGGSTDYLLAAGCGSQIQFWDWRNKKQVACLEESHVEDVTQVHFVPNNQNKVVSASVDGLICTFDTGGDINDDDLLESVINVGTSVGKVGFFGETNKHLWCLTHIETLSIWDWKDGQNVASFENARSLASDSWTLDDVDYFVDCHYPGEGENLWVIGGTGAGTVGYFPVNYGGAATIGPPEAVLVGGHTAVVRSVLPMPSVQGRPAQSHGIFGWTGGEDGRLCCWLSDDSSEINRSWISNAMVMRSPKTHKKNRHNPY